MAWNTTGCTVITAKESASSVLFAKDGQTTIRQIEIVETTEIRGLTEANAKGRVSGPTLSNDYAETTYYKVIDGATYQFLGRTGTETRHAARRVDETNQWVYTKTETTFSLNVNPTENAYGWSTIEGGNTLSADGVEVPVSSDKTATYQYKYGGEAICATVTTSVVEYRHVTTEGKNAYVALSSAGAQMYNHNYVRTQAEAGIGNPYGTLAYAIFMHGTDTQYSARYVSAQEGWTVTKTTKTYSWTGGAHWQLGSAA